MDSKDFFIKAAFASIVAAFIATCTFRFLTRTSLELKKKKKKRYHPIGGTVLNQLLNFNRLHHYMTDLACTHRTYRLLGLMRSEIYTSDLGDGIFTVDGEKWLDQRKVSSHGSPPKS